MPSILHTDQSIRLPIDKYMKCGDLYAGDIVFQVLTKGAFSLRHLRHEDLLHLPANEQKLCDSKLNSHRKPPVSTPAVYSMKIHDNILRTSIDLSGEGGGEKQQPSPICQSCNVSDIY